MKTADSHSCLEVAANAVSHPSPSLAPVGGLSVVHLEWSEFGHIWLSQELSHGSAFQPANTQV